MTPQKMINNFVIMRTRAIFFFSTAAFFWGLNFHLAKVMLAKVPFIEAGFWRYAFAMLILTMFSFKDLVTISSREIMGAAKGILLVGVIGLFGFNLFFFLGMQYTSALNASLIVSLNPAITLMLDSWLLGGKVSRRQKTGILIALVGVIFLLTKGEPTRLLSIDFAWGDILILIANLVFAFHHIWVKQFGGKTSISVFTFWTNAACLIGFGILTTYSGVTAFSVATPGFWLAAMGMGIPGTALAYWFWNRGIAEAGPQNAGFFMNVVPFATAVLAVFFGEELLTYHLISGALIIFGMIYSQRKR